MLVSKPFVKQWEEKLMGTAAKHINIRDLRVMRMAVPPLQEQQEIVSKVNQLMQLCDELEEQVKQSKEDSELLMQAVLREAFEE